MSDIMEVLARTREQVKRIYEVGKEVPLTDELTLWIQKLTPAEDKEAVSHSYGPRAAILSLLHADDDDAGLLEFIDTMRQLGLDDREAQINFLIAQDVNRAMESNEYKIAAEKEWSENDYLITLQESWNDGLKGRYDLDNEDEEAARIFKELKRYTEQVQKAVDHDRQDLYDRMSDKTDAELQRKVAKMFIEHAAGQAQIAEYHAWCIFLATRLPQDHSVRFFESRESVETYGAELYPQLLEAYLELAIGSIEGKD